QAVTAGNAGDFFLYRAGVGVDVNRQHGGTTSPCRPVSKTTQQPRLRGGVRTKRSAGQVLRLSVRCPPCPPEWIADYGPQLPLLQEARLQRRQGVLARHLADQKPQDTSCPLPTAGLAGKDSRGK